MIRLGFGVLERLEPDDTRRLLAQHRYFGGPLAGLHDREARLSLFKRRAVVDALPQLGGAYVRAPRRGVRK